MNSKRYVLSALIGLLTVLSASTPRAQEASAPAPKTSVVGKAAESDLTVRYFSPQKADADDLADTVVSLFGRHVAVYAARDGETYNGLPRYIDRVAQLGETLIIRDTAARAEELVRTLTELDKAVQVHQRVAPKPLALESFEYAPKHIGLGGLQNAMRSYERQILVQPQSTIGGIQEAVRNVSFVAERNLVIIREEPARVAEIKALLARLDVPAPEVVITCWLVRGLTSGDAATALPEALATNLKKLVPMAGYEQMAVGVIRSSVLSGNGIRLQAEVSGALAYTLRLEPAAYDAASGELAIARCQFELSQSSQEPTGGAPPRQSHHEFQTQVTLRPGEYTVLGTVGGDPVFVVLRLSKA